MSPDGPFAIVALALSLLTRGPIRQPMREPVHFTGDAWFGADKVKHCFLGAGALTLSFGALRALETSRRNALAGGWAFTIGVSIGKEIHDARGYGLFSLKDLTWDLACAGAATAVLARTQR